ncbi:PAS domain-containing sensor histidine kinase [Gemmatimonadota bacterium]
MSLRSKIIWLFVGLAVLPVLVLGGFGYWHALRLMEGTVNENLRATAKGVEHRIETGLREIHDLVDSLNDSPAVRAVASRGFSREAFDREAHPLLNRLAYIHVESPVGTVLAEAGDSGAPPLRCDSLGGSRMWEGSREIAGAEESGLLSFGLWVSDLVGRERAPVSHDLMIVDASDGAVLYSDRCEGLDTAPSLFTGPEAGAWRGARGGVGEFTYKAEGKRHYGVFLSLTEVPWIVVSSTSPSELLLPLGRLHLSYWAFVLVLAFSTVAAFSMLLGRVTRSLRDLTRAAEDIGRGQLDPWLPLPGGGEVGRLTEAFSRMLERVRQMMAQVNQNGRLAVVGQISAYLAHEIRNPLSSIKLNLQRLHRWTRTGQLPDFCVEPIEISLKEVDRLTAAVSGVLQLSRSHDTPRELLSFHKVVQEAADLIHEKALRQGVRLSLDLDAEADLVWARPGQLKSVVLNLMVNAMEAQPDGGFLEVESQLLKGREGEGPLVAVRFHDGGPGVPADVRDRVFEPFFTTKKTGSGIGLAVAYQSVVENRGRLYLEDLPDATAGAEFVVAFPLASGGTSESDAEGPVSSGWIHAAPAWPVRRETDSSEPGSETREGDSSSSALRLSTSSASAHNGSEEVN